MFANNASSNTTGVYAAAVDPWHHYHTAVNPPVVSKSDLTLSRTSPTWFEFAQGPANFFMADTRSYRSSNKIDFEDKDKTMLGSAQLLDLLAFLRRPEPRGVDWKVVAFSVPFTKNWPVNVQDTWGGFLTERQIVLEAMWDAAARGIGVIVLSGDRHEFAATKFPPPKDSRWTEEATVYEFSASPLSQFYSPIGTYRQVDDEDVKIKYASSLLFRSRLLQTPHRSHADQETSGTSTKGTPSSAQSLSRRYPRAAGAVSHIASSWMASRPGTPRSCRLRGSSRTNLALLISGTV